MIHRQGRVDILAQLFQFLRGGGLGGLLVLSSILLIAIDGSKKAKAAGE